VRRAALRGTLARADHPVPCVVLLSRSCDAEFTLVQDLLAAAGVPSMRINADELASAGVHVDLANRTAYVNGRWLAPTVTWIRHFSARAIEGTGVLAYDMFVRDSWQAAGGGLGVISGTTIGTRRRGILSQLLLAQRHGVAVPRTVITTDLSRAHAAFRSPWLVIKAAHDHFVEATPGRLHGVFPAIVEGRTLAASRWSGPPVIVQEFIEHEAELRVYYVHGQVRGFEVRKDSPASPWKDPARLWAASITTPPAVESATRVLASAMSLRYGAFDFLLRDGSPVFLEVNPDGDWRWAERAARTASVTLAAAQMLTELHRQARPRDNLDSFSLVAFLSRKYGP
jgi:hypothetical protein